MDTSTSLHTTHDIEIGQIVYRWASKYTKSESIRNQIVDRVIGVAIDDDCLIAAPSVETALSEIVHRIALEELRLDHFSTGVPRTYTPPLDILRGKRVLVAEDGFVQADDICTALRDQGVDIIGPFPRAKEALLYLKHDDVDCAILDVYLAEGKCFGIADALVERKKPYLFLTGFDKNTMPEEYRGAPQYPKPFPMRDIAKIVASSLASA